MLHTHMPYATALACIDGARLEPISQTALKFYERIAYDTDFQGMALDDDEGERLAAALADKPVLLMGNHGVTVVGRDIVEAFDYLYFLEKACETQVLAISTGQPLRGIDEVLHRSRRPAQPLSYSGPHCCGLNAARGVADLGEGNGGTTARAA